MAGTVMDKSAAAALPEAAGAQQQQQRARVERIKLEKRLCREVSRAIADFRMIEAGDQYASVLQSPVDDGRYAVEAALAILRGENVEKVRYLPHPVITLDNIRQCYPAIGR